MDDQTPVGVLHRVADGPEQTQALHDGRTPRVAVLDQGMSLDVLQDEERASVVRGPAVDQTGDARVLQARQDLPLAQETRQDLVGVEAPLEHLERGPLLELSVGALRQVHHTHPAAADLAQQPPRADAAALHPLRRRLLLHVPPDPSQDPGGVGPSRTVQDAVADLRGREEIG